MATASIQSQPTPNGSFKPIIETPSTQRKQGSAAFEPTKHIAFRELPKRIMMKDIGYAEDTGISPVAVSQPFRLFSQSAIQHMRDEILNPEVWDKHQFKSNIAPCQLRGYASKYAPFVFDAWNHPDTLDIISKIAGVDLVPSMNFEVGHVNFSVKSEKEAGEEIKSFERETKGSDDEKPVVGWHTDSYPFVCVLMLSDCTNMIGGETALRTGNGDVMKVRGPEMGCAVVMQGRYITHQALRALGAQERITMVTSFRPKSPFVRDDSVLTSVRPISDLSELYFEFAEYRLAMLEERVRTQLKVLRRGREASKKFNTQALKGFLAEQEAFIKHTINELVDDDKVPMGFIDELDIPDVGLEQSEQTSRLPARAKL